jgi:soluble lytic murein transglycosylase-like protein
VLAIAVAVVGWVAMRSKPGPASAQPSESAVPSAAGASSSSAPSQPVATLTKDQSPARFATQVITHAGKAGVNPNLLMAILYNESYKPHDPALERAWQKMKPDSAFGIANMHKAAFDEAKQGRDFAGRDWQELPDDPDLAIEAAAWHLHDLAAQLPAKWTGPYPKDELLALGYNAGASNMKAFAQGAKPGELAQSYLDRLRGNRAAAEEAIRNPN